MRFLESLVFIAIVVVFYTLVSAIGLKSAVKYGYIEKSETLTDLLDTGYTIKTTYNGRNESYTRTGSGTVFWANNEAYILTCGHVAECLLREIGSSVIEDHVDHVIKKVYREWEPAQIEKTYYIGNKEQVKKIYYANVILYSGVENGTGKHKGLDLALLKIRYDSLKTFPKKSARFVNDKHQLQVSDRIYHVGSLWGDLTESYVEGYVSRLDYMYLNNRFNVVKLGGCPGSSGGGIFTYKDGKYYYSGMVTRGDQATTMFIKPPEVIRQWLKDNNYDFIIK